jgi:hypothetical protein
LWYLNLIGTAFLGAIIEIFLQPVLISDAVICIDVPRLIAIIELPLIIFAMEILRCDGIQGSVGRERAAVCGGGSEQCKVLSAQCCNVARAPLLTAGYCITHFALIVWCVIRKSAALCAAKTAGAVKFHRRHYHHYEFLPPWRHSHVSELFDQHPTLNFVVKAALFWSRVNTCTELFD